MTFQDLPIKRKVMAVMLMTSVTVLLLSVAAFLVYDLITYHRMMVRNLSTTATIVAANSTPALASRNFQDAQEILDALRANPSVVVAALFDTGGDILVRYPAKAPIGAFPLKPGEDRYRSERGHLLFFEPVIYHGKRVGTLFLQSDLRPLYTRLKLYGGIALLVLGSSVLVAMVISNALQRQITRPILDLSEAAKVVSERGDYSVRASPAGNDELGVLTAAFNQMLGRIQESEEARSFLAAIVESSDDAIIGKNLQSRVVSWNMGAERMFGYSAAEIIGQPITCIQAQDHPAEEARIIEEVKRGGIRHYETVRIRKDGQPIEVSLTVSPIKDAHGKIIGISSILRDITEQKRAEEQIRRMNADLEFRVHERTAELTAANRELEGFTYSVAHDLRAPLRHMDAFSKIVMEDFASSLPSEARMYLENIRNGSRNMSRLVDDLLNLAHIGRQELKRQPTPLSSIIQNVVADLKEEAEGRALDWHIQPLPIVECDPGLMKQVFANLLSNAIKYTRPRPLAVIEVGCKQINGDSVIYVRDNGVGFNMKYADKLFGVFQRLHRPEEFEGTGVGLATVDRIVRKHGGCVWAEAAVDQGATFFFTLTAIHPPAQPSRAIPAVDGEVRKTPPLGN